MQSQVEMPGELLSKKLSRLTSMQMEDSWVTYDQQPLLIILSRVSMCIHFSWSKDMFPSLLQDIYFWVPVSYEKSNKVA